MDPTKEQRRVLYKSRMKGDGDPKNNYTGVLGIKQEPFTESVN
jgi:hypothetical protein